MKDLILGFSLNREVTTNQVVMRPLEHPMPSERLAMRQPILLSQTYDNHVC